MEVDSTLLMAVLFWFLAPLAILAAAGVLFRAKSFLGMACGAFVVNYLVRTIAIFINETNHFFAPKVQWRYGIGIYEKYMLTGDYVGLLFEPFGAQVLWNLPVWAFADADRSSLLLSNAAAGALAGSLAGLMVRSITSQRVAITVMVLFSLYLGAFNFSLFGLRDPLLALANAVVACVVLRFGFGQRGIQELFAGALGLGVGLWLRPEQFFIVVFILGLPVAAYYLGLFRRRRQRQRNLMTAILLWFPLLGICLAAVLAATLVAGKNIGTNTFNPVQIAEENAEDRFSRHLDSEFGAGSNIVDHQTYQNMPTYIRIPVQITGLILLPFPWQIKNAEQLLAFADSLFLIGLLFLSFRFILKRSSIESGRWVVIALLATFLIGICGMGFVVSNAGNGFRMRISVVPFLMVAAGLALGARPWRRQRYAL